MQRQTAIRMNPVIILLISAAFVLIAATATFAMSAPEASGTINASVVLRGKCSTSSKKVAKLAPGTYVTIHKEVFKSTKSTGSKNRWYQVTANGKKGYVKVNRVSDVSFDTVNGHVKSAVAYRKGAGTRMKKVGTFKKGANISVCLKAKPVGSTRGSSWTWYRVKAGSNYYYVCSNKIKLTADVPPEAGTGKTVRTGSILGPSNAAGGNLSDADFEVYMTQQGFPDSYKSKLRELHKAHRNWGFVAYHTNISWSTALSKETRSGVSLVHSSYGSGYRSGSKQVEPGWYNANSTVVAYYLDPRNFLTEDRVMMFEDLTYKPAYHTASVVSTILQPTKLPTYGFTPNIFVDAGAANNVSPVFLASRARQEVGGGSDAINGSTILGKKVYNPFNIGAFGGTNPLYQGLLYAYAAGWTTPAAAVSGGAAELSKYYISKGQHTIYYQRFNARNGSGSMGTHQYMTNIHAPYSESYNTKTSYQKYGILTQPLVFEVPVYTGMPSKTKLP